jgi:hypothetical protein
MDRNTCFSPSKLDKEHASHSSQRRFSNELTDSPIIHNDLPSIRHGQNNLTEIEHLAKAGMGMDGLLKVYCYRKQTIQKTVID